MNTRQKLAEVDGELLHRVASWPENPTLDDLTPNVLVSCVEQCGIDFATAMLYDRIRRDPRHQPFIAAVDRVQREQMEKVTNPRMGVGGPLVVVVPGAFYREFPSTGADGRRVIEETAQYGCRTEVIPISGFGSPRENGRAICDWLAQRREDNVILVSLSKGASDIKFALAQPSADVAFRSVSAWVSLSGILQGSPLSNWLLSRPIRLQLVRLQLWWFGYSHSVLRDLLRGSELDEMPLQLPSHMRLIHVVGFPLRHHLTNGLSRRGHRRLTVHGPNDAAMALADVLAWPGLIYPVWGADHYLRPAGCDMEVLFGRLLQWLLHNCSIEARCFV